MNRKNFPLTVEQIAKLAQDQIKMGNGKKYVLISNDEEGNGFHECYFRFTPAEDNIGQYADYPTDLNLKDCVTLG